MKKIELTEFLIKEHYKYCYGESGKKFLAKRPYGRILHYKNKDYPKKFIVGNKTIIIDLMKKTRKKMIDFLIKNFKEIIIAKPENLLSLESAFYADLYNSELKNSNPINIMLIKKKLKVFLSYIFNYNSFSKLEPENSWGPYQLLKGLNHSVCVYCNTQFILTIYREEEAGKKKLKLRPSLDHFFPKSLHPLLGISIYNLVPACHTCNSSLKLDEDCTLQNHIHPYIDNLDELGYFKREFNTNLLDGMKNSDDFYSQVVGRSDAYEIKFNALKKEDEMKVEGYKNLFEIETRYSFHKNFINDYVLKALIYNKIYLKQLDESYEKLFYGQKSLKNFLLEEDINNSILSKVLNDIATKELKLFLDN